LIVTGVTMEYGDFQFFPATSARVAMLLPRRQNPDCEHFLKSWSLKAWTSLLVLMIRSARTPKTSLEYMVTRLKRQSAKACNFHVKCGSHVHRSGVPCYSQYYRRRAVRLTHFHGRQAIFYKTTSQVLDLRQDLLMLLEISIATS
jgi:hypothetical protein